MPLHRRARAMALDRRGASAGGRLRQRPRVHRHPGPMHAGLGPEGGRTEGSITFQLTTGFPPLARSDPTVSRRSPFAGRSRGNPASFRYRNELHARGAGDLDGQALGARVPVAGSTRKTTIVPEDWFSARTYEPVGS